MIEQRLEEEIQAKGLTVPRITPSEVDAAIVAEQYHVFPGTTTTVCCLTLRNGFTVVGASGAASPENFNEEIGRTVARDKARDQIWPLLGYALRQRLADVQSALELARTAHALPGLEPASALHAPPKT